VSYLNREVQYDLGRRQMSAEARQIEFEQLSEKVAQNMPYQTREEFEQAMRGDDYGLARY